MAGFYWGMLHPFTAGPQMLLLLAFALFLQQRLPDAEDAFTGLWAGSILGGAAAATGIIALASDLTVTAAAVLLGVLVVSEVRFRSGLLWVAGGFAGLLNGYMCWPEPGPFSDMLFAGLGALVGSILIVIVLGGSIELLRLKAGWPWLGIAVRVAGSWIVAVSVLLGAVMLRPGL
jgi:hydrogenase/urease accessory protein HupE